MVVDDLWFDLRGLVDLKRIGLHDSRDVMAGSARTDECGGPDFAFQRLGQLAFDSGNALDLLRILAVLDHLVRKSAGRDNVVRRAQAGWLGRNRIGDCHPPIRVSVSDASVARDQEEFAETGAVGDLDSSHAHRRRYLVNQTNVQSGQISFELDGCDRADRDRWTLASNICVAVTKTFAGSD